MVQLPVFHAVIKKKLFSSICPRSGFVVAEVGEEHADDSIDRRPCPNVLPSKSKIDSKRDLLGSERL